MKDITAELKKQGCDMDGALARFLDDKELYLSCLPTVVDDDNFVKLGNALESHDVQVAFDCAHTLKGVLANMGLTPMLDAVVKIVEPLRAGNDDGLLPIYEKLILLKNELGEMIAE